MMKLRDYQEQLIRDVKKKFAKGKKRVVMQAPTGSGKTVTFVELAKRTLEKNPESAVLISISHSSKPSLVRWFKAGNVPTIPFLQHSITSLGPEIKNIGAAIAGMDNSFINEGVLIIVFLCEFNKLK